MGTSSSKKATGLDILFGPLKSKQKEVPKETEVIEKSHIVDEPPQVVLTNELKSIITCPVCQKKRGSKRHNGICKSCRDQQSSVHTFPQSSVHTPPQSSVQPSSVPIKSSLKPLSPPKTQKTDISRPKSPVRFDIPITHRTSPISNKVSLDPANLFGSSTYTPDKKADVTRNESPAYISDSSDEDNGDDDEDVKIKSKKTKSGNRKRRHAIPKPMRKEVWDIYGGGHSVYSQCYVCDEPVHILNFECAHVIADVNGGETTTENLRVTCLGCNRSCGDKHLDDFKASVSKKRLEKGRQEETIIQKIKDANIYDRIKDILYNNYKLYSGDRVELDEREKDRIIKKLLANIV